MPFCFFTLRMACFDAPVAVRMASMDSPACKRALMSRLGTRGGFVRLGFSGGNHRLISVVSVSSEGGHLSRQRR